MNSQLYRAGLLLQWRIYLILDKYFDYHYEEEEKEEKEEEDYKIAKELHPNDGIDEEQHSHQHTHVGKSLYIDIDILFIRLLMNDTGI